MRTANGYPGPFVYGFLLTLLVIGFLIVVAQTESHAGAIPPTPTPFVPTPTPAVPTPTSADAGFFFTMSNAFTRMGKAFTRDGLKISNLTSLGDLSAIGAACQDAGDAAGSSVAEIQGLTPPDGYAGLYQTAQQSLSDLEQAAGECATGAYQDNAPMMQQSFSDMLAADKELRAMGNEIQDRQSSP